MTALVVLLTAVVAILALLVVGLLRSHAEILKRLHDLGADVFDDRDPPDPAAAHPLELRTRDDVPQPRAVETAAHDLAGMTPSGSSAVVGVLGRPHATLLAFLSTTCLTCEEFWRALATGPGPLPGRDTRLVIVTRGPESESPPAVQAIAPPGVTTVMSSEAWTQYQVPVSPYFILVDGPSSRVIGEGAAATWDQVASLLERAGVDAGITAAAGPLHARSHLRGGRARERNADEQLLAAGIGPDHPSLHGGASPEIHGPSDPSADSSGGT